MGSRRPKRRPFSSSSSFLQLQLQLRHRIHGQSFGSSSLVTPFSPADLPVHSFVFCQRACRERVPFFPPPGTSTPTTHHVNQQHVGLVLSFIKLQGTSSHPRKALLELKGTYTFRLHVDDNCRYLVLGCLLAVTVTTLAPGKTSSVSSSQKDPHQKRQDASDMSTDCISLRGSKQCPAFSSASISVNDRLVGQ